MKKLLTIIAFSMVCIVSYGQSTNDRVVFIQAASSNLYSNLGGSWGDISEAMGFYRPAYACVSIAADPENHASSVYVTNGTIESGSITSTWETDQVYLLVGESGQFKVDFTITNITALPSQVKWTGYYDGNPAHVINIDMWNYTSNAWETIFADAIPSGVSDTTVTAIVPIPQTNYNVGGVVSCRFDHVSSAVASHDFATDHFDIIVSQVTVTNAGTYEIVGGLMNCVDPKLMGVNLATGVITSLVDGVFEVRIGGTWTGTSNTTFTVNLHTNDVSSDIFFRQTISADTSFENAAASDFIRTTNGMEFSIGITADRSGATATFVNFSGEWKRIDN